MPDSKLLRLLAILAAVLAPLPAWAASFPQGVDLRGTAAFVTDPTNYAAELTNGTNAAADYPTTTAQGNTVGWESVHSGADRNSGVDARLAGINYAPTGGTATYRIDLPSAGTYAIQAAFGDDGFAQSGFTVQLEDGTTVFATPVNNGSAAIGQFFSANGTLRDTTTWPANNPAAGGGADEITHTFTTTTFRIVLTSVSSASVMASIFVRSVSAGPACPKTRTLMGAGC